MSTAAVNQQRNTYDIFLLMNVALQKLRRAVRRLLVEFGLTSDPYAAQAAAAGYQDVNDFLEAGSDAMASRAMGELFSREELQLRSGKLLEVGARTGRFTREIVKYLPNTVEIVCLEHLYVACYGLTQYAARHNWKNVTVVHGDFFANSFKDETFDVVILPWFAMTISLYRWAQILRETARILRRGGVLAFDFMDSRDDLLRVVSKESNAPYFLINGDDLETIAAGYGLTKISEFGERFNEQIAKYHIYRKDPGHSILPN